MKDIKIIFILLFLILLTGCSHNIYSSSKGCGVSISWNGNSYVPKFDVGYFDNVSFCVKDNVEIEFTNKLEGGLDTASTNSSNGNINANNQAVHKIKIGPQTTGYVKDVLINPNAKNNYKIAEAIYGVKVSEEDKK